MSIGPSLRGTLSKYVPTWLGNVPGLRNLYSVLWSIALAGDCLRETAWQGQLAAYPGVGTATALPYIGSSRGLVQGPNESNDLFVQRCRTWRAAIALMGSSQGLLAEIQSYLIGQGSLGAGVYPIVAFIDRYGHMTTINASQTLTQSIVSWDWDDLGGWVNGVGYNPPTNVENWWADGWILIQDPYTHYTGWSDSNWLAAWNSGDQTVDSLTPQQIVSGVLGIVERWRGAHVYVRSIVWCASPSSYVSTPNGYYGNWGRNESGDYVPSRDDAESYWQPGGQG